MPNRARSHVLEEESVRRFRDALPSRWVFRGKAPDYGIDGEVEVFNSDGSSTGLTFNVQLRATDDETRVDRVRLEIDELNYYSSLDVPTVVVRYGSPEGTFFWQWASKISSHVEIAEGQQTVTYQFGDDERWTVNSHEGIRRTLEVRRRLAHFPPGRAMPLRVDLTRIPPADRFAVDRMMARMIAESRGALVRAADSPEDVEAFVRVESGMLAVGIDTITGVTFDLQSPTADEYLASILYALVRLFRRQRLPRHAEALALLLDERGLAHENRELAVDACVALTRELPALVRLAVLNGLHEQGPWFPLIAMTIVQAPHDDVLRIAAADTFFEAALAAARAVATSSEAAVHYSIGNL